MLGPTTVGRLWFPGSSGHQLRWLARQVCSIVFGGVRRLIRARWGTYNVWDKYIPEIECRPSRKAVGIMVGALEGSTVLKGTFETTVSFSLVDETSWPFPSRCLRHWEGAGQVRAGRRLGGGWARGWGRLLTRFAIYIPNAESISQEGKFFTRHKCRIRASNRSAPTRFEPPVVR